MKNETTLTGLVLCGGKSSRMGTDKGMILKGGKTWAQLAYEKLKLFSSETTISVNPTQLEQYQKFFDEELLIEDSVELKGPLAGFLSIHQQLPYADLLVLACDMTDVSIDTIQHLIATYEENQSSYDFFVYQNQEDYEPLLGIYTAKGLKKISLIHAQGKLKKHSMKYVLGIGNTYSISISEKQEKEFKNYNEQKDL